MPQPSTRPQLGTVTKSGPDRSVEPADPRRARAASAAGRPPPPLPPPPAPPPAAVPGSRAASTPAPGRRRTRSRYPPPGPVPPAPGMLGAAHKPGAIAAAAARARRHLRRGVPDHPLQPEGDRRLGGPGHRGGDADPGRWSPRCSPGRSTCRSTRGSDGVHRRRGGRPGRRLRLARCSASCCSRIGLVLVTGMVAHVTMAAARRPAAHAWARPGPRPRGKRCGWSGWRCCSALMLVLAARAATSLLWVAGGRRSTGTPPIARLRLVIDPGVPARPAGGSGSASTTCRCRP